MDRTTLVTMARDYLGATPHGEMDFDGRPIIVLPTVLPPDLNTVAFSHAAMRMAASLVPAKPGKLRVFEMGVGTGGAILSVASKLPIDASAGDISEMATINARANALWWKVGCDVYESDLFDAVPSGSFDLLMWNIPWLPDATSSGDDAAPTVGFDVAYDALRRFLEAAASGRLAPQGRILLGVDRLFCDRELISRRIDEAGFSEELFHEATNTWSGIELKLDFIALARKG